MAHLFMAPLNWSLKTPNLIDFALLILICGKIKAIQAAILFYLHIMTFGLGKWLHFSK